MTLLDLADSYEHQAMRFTSSQRDRRALNADAAIFRSMALSQKAADPATLRLGLELRPGPVPHAGAVSTATAARRALTVSPCSGVKSQRS